MKKRIGKPQRGFSLLELMIASAVGLVVIAAMTSLFKIGMDATFTVTQRAETQQNMRAAVELMTQDISLAGSGLPSGGLQLVTGGTVSKFSCNQTGTCYVPAGTYPASGGGVPNFMYGIIPGFNTGVQGGAVITAAPGQVNSSITSIYCDYNFPLTNFNFTFPGGPTQATVTVINAGVQPNNILAAGGLNPGDLILFTVSTPGNGNGNNGTSLIQNAAVVAEVTTIPNNTTINFASGDALNMNQTGAGTSNNLSTVIAASGAGTQMSACRLYAVSYFLQVPVAGGTVQTPRLMRQVNGRDAVPVADNIINMQFTYDVIDSVAGTVTANSANPLAAGLSPALIQKVNLWVMGQGMTTAGRKAQSMYLATSVAARNMSFCNSYSSATTVCQ